MAFPIAFAKSFLVTPSRLNHAGGLLSNFQSSVLPSLFFASTKTTIWGFCHCTSVRVPVSVNFLDVSKMAENEWCAHRGPTAKRVVKIITMAEILYLKEVLRVRKQKRKHQARHSHSVRTTAFLKTSDGLPITPYSCEQFCHQIHPLQELTFSN